MALGLRLGQVSLVVEQMRVQVVRGEARKGIVVQWEIIPMLGALFSTNRQENGPCINICALI
jgi:hypothetical protein